MNYPNKQPIFFCKSRNRTHTAFSFFGWFASQNRAKSGKSFIFYAYTKNISHDFEKRKSKTPPAGQVCKSQNQNQKTYANTLMRKLTHRKSSATHPAPSQSVVTIVSLHDDKQQQDWPPDVESTRTLVRCFEWANVVLRKPLGSHSPCTKLKTHYSEQLHCYNNTLLNLVPSEHSPSENVRIHIMVMLRNTRCDVTKTSIGI